MTSATAGERIARMVRLVRVEEAYRHEAARLDANELADWCNWLHTDFRYEVPVPVTRDDSSQRMFSAHGLLAAETKPTIELWVKRLSDGYIDTAFAENPPVRTRHFVGNVRITAADEPDTLRVSSNVLLSWNQRGEPPMFATAERLDILVDRGEELLLRERRVLLDSDVVHLNHLRVIF